MEITHFYTGSVKDSDSDYFILRKEAYGVINTGQNEDLYFSSITPLEGDTDTLELTIIPKEEGQDISNINIDALTQEVNNFASSIPNEINLVEPWDSETYYLVGDVVAHNGFVWRATTNNISNEPDDVPGDWEKLK